MRDSVRPGCTARQGGPARPVAGHAPPEHHRTGLPRRPWRCPAAPSDRRAPRLGREGGRPGSGGAALGSERPSPETRGHAPPHFRGNSRALCVTTRLVPLSSLSLPLPPPPSLPQEPTHTQMPRHLGTMPRRHRRRGAGAQQGRGRGARRAAIQTGSRSEALRPGVRGACSASERPGPGRCRCGISGRSLVTAPLLRFSMKTQPWGVVGGPRPQMRKTDRELLSGERRLRRGGAPKELEPESRSGSPCCR